MSRDDASGGGDVPRHQPPQRQQSPQRPSGPATPPPQQLPLLSGVPINAPDGWANGPDTTATLVLPSTVQTPTRFRQPIRTQPPPVHSAPPKIARTTQQPYPQPQPPRSSTTSLPTHQTPRRQPRAARPAVDQNLRKIRYSIRPQRQRSSGAAVTAPQPERSFQVAAYYPSVRVRTISLAQRAAFAPRPLPSLEEWTAFATARSEQRHTNVSIRMSPSYQHLQVLQALRGRRPLLPQPPPQQQSPQPHRHRDLFVRQLQFSPSTGQDADPFVHWLQADNYYDPVHRRRAAEANGAAVAAPDDAARDGRYRSIDPVAAALAPLPMVPPRLSHRRHRLPMRSDVGFPEATEEEVRLKQREIQQETEWEEASPRLVVLVTADDLGAVLSPGDDGADDSRQRNDRWQHAASSEWNGGGLPGMPFAGRELLQAKERNEKYFRGKSLERLRPFMEANPYSMLAPPLAASYSPSHAWRPRPYHDRAPGLQYVIACPVDVILGTEDVEPLICSLALYTLPMSATVERGQACGKISEEFWFPAGRWDSDKVYFEGARREDGTIDDDVLEAWMKRKKKAIFSYDPMVLALNGGPCSCFLVLQVYRLVCHDGTVSYVKKDGDSVDSQIGALDPAEDACSPLFGLHESQLLTPLCFGVTHLYDASAHANDSSKTFWPLGSTRDVQLLPHPLPCESQEEFVSRLIHLVHTNVHFIAPLSQAINEAKLDTKHTMGSGRIFISDLAADFLQCMLSSPSELEIVGAGETAVTVNALPKVCVDVSGDCAVLLEADAGAPGGETHSQICRRSNLLRLPAHQEASGYAAVAEFQELLYLPPRPEKHYDTDAGMPCQSQLNLLYLYPRKLRLSHDPSFNCPECLTLRLRVIDTTPKVNGESKSDHSRSLMRAFYNPAFWTGSPLLDTYFTKLRSCGSDEIRNGAFLRDEIKVRLPEILDGSFFLEVTLFSVEMKSGDAELQNIATVSIPLSTSSNRGDEGMGRIATVIPNGNHRLKLGIFQLQLETRLISSIHVGDPALATVLRDFPSHATHAQYTASVSFPSSSASVDSTGDKTKSLTFTLSKVSGASVAAHFETLLFLIAGNLVQSDNNHSNESPSFIMNNLLSLFELLRKIKEHFSEGGQIGRRRMASFFKQQVDVFEESHLTLSSLLCDANELTRENGGDDFQPNQSDDDVENVEPVSSSERKQATKPKRRTRRLSSHHHVRMSRLVENLTAAGLPISRVAYGAASKFDHMLLQSESYNEPSSFGFYFEDDETVFTAPTVKLPLDVKIKKDEAGLALSQVRSPKSGIPVVSEAASDDQLHLHGGQEFAQRVRSVAQIMLAPCGVGPAAFMPQSVGPAVITSLSNQRLASDISALPKHVSKDEDGACLPGSDTDERGLSSPDPEDGILSQADEKFRTREKADLNVLILSVGSFDSKEMPVTRGRYLYETIIINWLWEWLTYVESTRIVEVGVTSNPYNSKPSVNSSLKSFMLHRDVLLPLCLKSICLRHHAVNAQDGVFTSPAIIDENHLLILGRFVEMLAKGLMEEALSDIASSGDRQSAVIGMLEKSAVIIDFLIGLSGILHPYHLKFLLKTYLGAIQSNETDDSCSNQVFIWTEKSLHRAICARQLILRTVEAFAALPSFMTLNFPQKFGSHRDHIQSTDSIWTHQVNNQKITESLMVQNKKLTADAKLPQSGWLADLLINEALSICASCCETVIGEALTLANISSNENGGEPKPVSTLKNRPGAQLRGEDLLLFESMGIHAITCVYELILRRQSMDKRFQNGQCQERVAGVVANSVLDESIEAVKWLAQMDSKHKIRSLWMLCVIYVLQEAPESLISHYVVGLCNPNNVRIHRFIRLLRLGSSTFQNFIYQPSQESILELGPSRMEWLVQECFNTICATTIIIVEDCTTLISAFADEKDRLMAGTLDLLLHTLTMPQSPVTQLRAVGCALQVLEKFGVQSFLVNTGHTLQHWMRIILTLLNSTSLSVRSMTVDFLVSLLGNVYRYVGYVDEITTMIATILPEVAAREIAIYSISGLLSNSEDVAKCLWPLRRSIADLEDTNPADDNRIDSQLMPILSVFCRACQAILDGVMVEMRLLGESLSIIDSKVLRTIDCSFDADEESLLEAAAFFAPETAPMQRLRWLLRLKSLHVAKGQWIEAGETLMMCAATITGSMLHLKNVWRPSRYDLWMDKHKSPWLETIGKDSLPSDCGNAQVMECALLFLEPANLLGQAESSSASMKLKQPSIPAMASMLTSVSEEAIDCYNRHDGMGAFAYSKMQSLLMTLMQVAKHYASGPRDMRSMNPGARRRRMEDDLALQKAINGISCGLMKISENVSTGPNGGLTVSASSEILANKVATLVDSMYIVVRISGKKPPRFKETTGIPSFLEFDVPHICRLKMYNVRPEVNGGESSSQKTVLGFADDLLRVLSKECPEGSVIVRSIPWDATDELDDSKTILHIFSIDAVSVESAGGTSSLQSKVFFYRKSVIDGFEQPTVIEMKVAQSFPGVLSRQRVLVTTEIIPAQTRYSA